MVFATAAVSVMACGVTIATTPSVPGSDRQASSARRKRSGPASSSTSTGLPRDQLCGSSSSRSFTVSGENSAIASPLSVARSTAMTPGPPPFVTIAR
jgi:hypothetical protein